MAASETKITGVVEFAGALANITNAVKNKLMRKAVRAASAPLRSAIRGRAPRDKGNLAKSITVQVKAKRNVTKTAKGFRTNGPSRVYARIGPAKGARGDRHAHLVEFGTAPRRTKAGKFVGAMPAKPFIRPSVEATRGQVQAILASEIAGGIQTEAAKQRKG